jgi:hypothetical protein
VPFRGVKRFGNMMEVSLEHEGNYQIDICLVIWPSKEIGEKQIWSNSTIEVLFMISHSL